MQVGQRAGAMIGPRLQLYVGGPRPGCPRLDFLAWSPAFPADLYNLNRRRLP